MKRQGMLSQSVHRKCLIIQSHMKIRENQNPQKNVDKKLQRMGRGIWWKDEDLDSSSLSFKKLWYFRYVTNLKFSKAISLFSNEVNTNHIIGFEWGANETCFFDHFDSIGGACWSLSWMRNPHSLFPLRLVTKVTRSKLQQEDIQISS